MNKTAVPVTISFSTIAKVVLTLLIFYGIYFLRNLVLVVLTAIVIASAVEPATRFLKRYRVNRLLAIISIYIIAATILAGAFYFFIPILLTDMNSLLSSLPTYVDRLSAWNPLSDSAILGFGTARQLTEGISMAPTTAVAEGGILSNLARLSAAISEGGIIQTASYFFGGFLSLVLIIVLSFYLAVQENGIEKFLRVVIPSRHETYVVGLWKRAQEKIALWAQGQFVLALLVGILVYLGLTLLGVRNALLFAFLAAVFEVIPLFGPILAAIPAVAVSFVDGGFSGGLITAGLYVVIQQFENHLIYPLVVQKIVGVSPIIVIIALIAGYQIAGFLGFILSVPLATVLVEVMNDFERHKAKTAVPA